MIQRRSLLATALVACAAPAYVKACNLMKLCAPAKVWVPDFSFNGSHDFTLEGWVNGTLLDELRLTGIERDLTPLVAQRGYSHIAVTGKGMYRDGQFIPKGPTTIEFQAINIMVAEARACGIAFQ